MRQAPTPGFTLFELLLVIAIIAATSALVLGGGHYVVEKGKIVRAQTEVGVVAAALEAYKRDFGDYPRTADATVLLQSLIGKRHPNGAAISARCRLEVDRLHTNGARDPFDDSTAVLVDPWDRPYVYAYKPDAAWTNPDFVLYSEGPDEFSEPLPASGTVDFSARANRDNVYANL